MKLAKFRPSPELKIRHKIHPAHFAPSSAAWEKEINFLEEEVRFFKSLMAKSLMICPENEEKIFQGQLEKITEFEKTQITALRGDAQEFSPAKTASLAEAKRCLSRFVDLKNELKYTSETWKSLKSQVFPTLQHPSLVKFK